MYTNLIFDMDDTLCDTNKANEVAVSLTGKFISDTFNVELQEATTKISRYLAAIYGEVDSSWTIIDSCDLNEKRRSYLANIFEHKFSCDDYLAMQDFFNDTRMQAFDFFPEVKSYLLKLKKHYTLGVITNGHAHSQLPKLARVEMEKYVSYVLVGGLEKEQKPAKSIFDKALQLASKKAEESLFFGDDLYADIHGSNNAKIDSVWLCHSRKNDSCFEPKYILESLELLPQLFNKLEMRGLS